MQLLTSENLEVSDSGTKADPRAVAGAGTQAGAETNIRVMPGSLILKRAPIGQNSSIVTSATPSIC